MELDLQAGVELDTGADDTSRTPSGMASKMASAKWVRRAASVSSLPANSTTAMSLGGVARGRMRELMFVAVSPNPVSLAAGGDTTSGLVALYVTTQWGGSQGITGAGLLLPPTDLVYIASTLYDYVGFAETFGRRQIMLNPGEDLVVAITTGATAVTTPVVATAGMWDLDVDAVHEWDTTYHTPVQ